MTHSTTNQRRAVVYARISDDREGRRYGVDRQAKDSRQLAERNGDEVVALFVDDDRSAYSGKPRPEYIKMLAYLQAGHAESVYALAPTRLYRRLDDGLEFFKLINELGLSVETVKAGRYNLSTADGRRDALRAAIDAQHESELIGERVRDAKADNVTRGEYRGGPRPYGWESDGVTPRTLLCATAGCSSESGFSISRRCLDCGADTVNEPGSEMWYIERGIDGILARESLRSIVRAANKDGARTPERRFKQDDGSKGDPESHQWSESTFRRVLLRPRNAGLIEHDGEIAGRAQWPPAVSEDKWRAAVDILQNPARRTITTNARVWLLSGIAKCWCGSIVKCSSAGLGGARTRRSPDGPDGEMIVVERKGHIAAYRCRATGGHVTRRAAALDAYIEAMVIDRLSRPDAATLFAPPPRDEQPREELAAQANTLRAKLESISADYGQDLISRAQMLEMTSITRGRLEQLESKMAARAAESVLASIPLGDEDIGTQWESYDLDKKRAIVAATMDITFKPAKRGPRPGGGAPGSVDIDSIEIHWKRPAA